MLSLVARYEASGRCHYSPPRHGRVGPSEESADRSGGAREASFGCDLSIGNDLSGSEPGEHRADSLLEWRHGPQDYHVVQ